MSGVVTGANRRYIAPLAALAGAGALALYISSSRGRQEEKEFVREARSHKRHSENDQPVKDQIQRRQETRERLLGQRDQGAGSGSIKETPK